MADVEVVEVQTQKFTNNKEIIAYLAEKFPLCFSTEGEAKPLKVGIFQDLSEALEGDERVSKTQLRQVLRQYTSNWRYLHGCREGAQRVDLQGNACGVLEKEHAEHAAEQLQTAKAKLAEKRAAEKAANAKPHKKGRNKISTSGQEAQSRKTNTHLKRKPKLDLTSVDMEKLSVNDVVKVKAGDRTQHATVLEVYKDSARVQLNNGLVISVNADRLFNNN
ncbi:RNA chaperone ProQ [Conservatibacter flavescens]|uniref:RNA chaperone ProQ n=1 Tax=Conservatibacter flavescens TaxID=28161 RepID=A0A2M8S617_9PAST|nr:RNA chaperone ProQ [Conservatibacter flavescens]PJG86574.1 RNA chaperone ProQ [Conservatibacter flavescens]